MLVGCTKKDDEVEDKGLTLSELISDLQLEENQVYSFDEDTFVLGSRFEYNGSVENINTFKYLGINQYEIKTNKHTFIIGYNGKSVYLTVDDGVRHLYSVKTIEGQDDPIEDPEKPKDPVDEGLSEETLFAYLLNNNETWSTSDDSKCIQFNIDRGYAEGYWPEGITTGFGELKQFEYGGDNTYRLTYCWEEVKDNELMPDRDAYSASIIITFDPENADIVDVSGIDGKRNTFITDKGTNLTQVQLWEALEGQWDSTTGNISYRFDIEDGEYSIYISEDEAEFNGDVAKDFISFGHYEYLIVFDTHLYMDIPGGGTQDNGAEYVLDVYYKPNGNVLKISVETVEKEYKKSDSSSLEN